MTVPSETNRSGPYNGNGSTTDFAYGFRIVDEDHLRVILTSALGVEATLTIDTDYTVSDVGEAAGGEVTLADAPATGETITILRNVPFVQETDLENQGAYYAETVEDAFDLAAMRDQQLVEELGRAIRVPASTDPDTELQLPAPEAGKIIAWNESADGLQNLSPEELSSVVAYGTANADIFEGDGATTVFALSANPAAINNLDVAIGGVTQLPGVDYTWSNGTNITFTTAPADGVTILVRYMQALAQGTTEDELVSSDDGAGGSLWSNVKQFIAYLRSTVGAAIVGFSHAGSYPYGTVGKKLRQFVSPYDAPYNATGDGVADDTAAIAAAIASGNDVDLSGGDWRITSKISGFSSGQRIYGRGTPRVGDNGRILVDNPTLDYVFEVDVPNVTCEGFGIVSEDATTAEAFLFQRADGEASDIDARLYDLLIEGLTNGVTVVGRGLHVKRCDFGNLTRGIALDWPTDWTPNGQSNDLQETGARSYMIEDNLFHGTADWVTNTGANAQNVRSIIMSGNLGDIGGTMFSGVLVDGVIDASISNINATSGASIDLHAGSRNSTILGARHGGIIEGAADRTSNNCLNIATTTANPTKDITVIGGSFGPCERNAIQIFGDGAALGLKFIGFSIDRPAQTTGGGYTPIAIFNSGGTLTKVEASFIGGSIDMTGSDSTVVIGGTNTGVIEVHWIGNQVRNFPTAPLAIAQSAVNVFQEGGEVNPKHTQFSRKNGTWATDGTEWLYRMEAKTMDVSGGGVGVSGSVTLRPSSSTQAASFWRFAASSSSVRDVGVLDLSTAGLFPVTDNAIVQGSSSLRFSNMFSGIYTLIDGVAAPGTVSGHAQIYVDTADGDLKVKFGDGTVKTIVVDT